MLQFIGVDLTETQPQLVIERTDYTPEWRLGDAEAVVQRNTCLLYTSPSPRDATLSRMPSSA